MSDGPWSAEVIMRRCKVSWGKMRRCKMSRKHRLRPGSSTKVQTRCHDESKTGKHEKWENQTLKPRKARKARKPRKNVRVKKREKAVKKPLLTMKNPWKTWNSKIDFFTLLDHENHEKVDFRLVCIQFPEDQSHFQSLEARRPVTWPFFWWRPRSGTHLVWKHFLGWPESCTDRKRKKVCLR